MKINLIWMMIFIFLGPILHAQLPYTFTEKGYIDVGDGVSSITIATDNTIFITRFFNGLYAYTFDGSTFINTAHVNDTQIVNDVTVDGYGNVFTANDDDGIWAYTYDGKSFTNTAHINTEGYSNNLAVDSNGTIFVANSHDGLRAYTYDGSSFINTAHIDDHEGEAFTVIVDSLNTIYILYGGLYAYKYNGQAFTNYGWINTNGLDIVTGPIGIIYVTDGYLGLRAYNYNGNFTKIAEIRDSDFGEGLDIGEDGTIFRAMGSDGLGAYFFNRDSFSKCAAINNRGQARDVVVGNDGTVFSIGYGGELFAYEYSQYVGVKKNLIKNTYKYSFEQNYPNPFNNTTTISYILNKYCWVSLILYNINGEKLKTLVNSHQGVGTYRFEVNSSYLPSGIYFYKLQIDDEFTDIKKMVLLK